MVTDLCIWRENEVIGLLLDAVACGPRMPLNDVADHEEPGIYLLSGWLDAPPYAGTQVGRGELPVLVGKARCLCERTRYYQQTLADHDDFGSLMVSVLRLGSEVEAAAVEALLIRELDPCWNRTLPGAGSRRFGTAREAKQHRTPFGSFFPRSWERDLPSRDVSDLLLAVEAHVLGQEDCPPLWAPLTPS